VEELLAARFPRPDVRDLVRRLPAQSGLTLDVGCSAEKAKAVGLRASRGVNRRLSFRRHHSNRVGSAADAARFVGAESLKRTALPLRPLKSGSSRCAHDGRRVWARPLERFNYRFAGGRRQEGWYARRVARLSFKHSLRSIPVVLAIAATFLTGCGAPGQNVVRSDAARRFSCAESRVKVEDWGPRTAHATGCGQSLTYSCQQSRGPAQAPPVTTPLTESEARTPAQSGGPCTWVPND